MISSKMSRLSFLFLSSLCVSCGSSTSEEVVERFGADAVFDTVTNESSVRLEGVGLTTEIDSITFRPAAEVSRVFPAHTERLFLCFILRNATPGSRLVVQWFRDGDRQPLSMTSEVVGETSRLAAEHVAARPFLPGPHYVQLLLENEEVGRVDFEIEGSGGGHVPSDQAIQSVRVTNFGMYAGLNSRGQPIGKAANRFRVGVKRIACAFRVNDAPPETAVEVHWFRNGSKVAATELGTVVGSRALSAEIANQIAFPRGDYRAEVTLNGVARGSTRFAIGQPAASGISVSNLALTTEVNARTRRPSRETSNTFRGTEEVLYLCLSYNGLEENDLLEVRWIQDSHPEEPMAMSTIRASYSGNLSASFSPDSSLPPGDYHVDVLHGGEVLDSIAFSVTP